MPGNSAGLLKFDSEFWYGCFCGKNQETGDLLDGVALFAQLADELIFEFGRPHGLRCFRNPWLKLTYEQFPECRRSFESWRVPDESEGLCRFAWVPENAFLASAEAMRRLVRGESVVADDVRCEESVEDSSDVSSQGEPSPSNETQPSGKLRGRPSEIDQAVELLKKFEKGPENRDYSNQADFAAKIGKTPSAVSRILKRAREALDKVK